MGNDSSSPVARTVTIERIQSVTGLEQVRGEWDGFVEAVGSDVYFTVDWLQAWWTYYGDRRVAECLIVRDGARVIGVLPFFVERIWVGPIPTRVARFIGADSTIPVFTPALSAGTEEAALAAAIEHLVRVVRCDAVVLSSLSAESPAVVAAEAAAVRADVRLVRSDTSGPHTVFTLPATFDEYLGSLSKTARQDHRRFERQLQKRCAIEYAVVTGQAAVESFDEFVALHAAHWRPRGKLGHFGDWPDGERFNRDLVVRFADDARARFYVVRANGAVVSMEYSFVLGNRCFWRLPARDTDPELEKMRLGRVSLAEMFRMLIDEGVTEVEAGPAHYDYKVRLGAIEHPLRRIIIARNSRAAVVRMELILRWSWLLHLVYYRIWFNRVAPRIGLGGRPLWRRWVRRRL